MPHGGMELGILPISPTTYMLGGLTPHLFLRPARSFWPYNSNPPRSFWTTDFRLQINLIDQPIFGTINVIYVTQIISYIFGYLAAFVGCWWLHLYMFDVLSLNDFNWRIQRFRVQIVKKAATHLSWISWINFTTVQIAIYVIEVNAKINTINVNFDSI